MHHRTLLLSCAALASFVRASPPPYLAHPALHPTSSPAMSSMPATEHHSAACCNVPPVKVDYDPQGTYETVDELKTYITGPADAKKGILVVYDIFGFYPQTLQGADILSRGASSSSSSSSPGYRVVMPDWFDGDAAPLAWYPPDTPQKEKDLGAWFANWPPTRVVERAPRFLAAARERFPETTHWAIIGYCWGGKVAALLGATDLVEAAVACHPAMIDPKDAAAVRVPYALLASKDEDAGDVAAFEKELQVPHLVETFGDMIHGWMAARGDLNDEHVREEYARGYKVVVDFLEKHF